MERAIGIIRVSEVGDREEILSPHIQRQRIEDACERNGWELLWAKEELDVKGKTPLEKRPCLREAVETIEAKDAEIVVAAYFDRLIRSFTVQAEMVRRVEGAGGKVIALDFGEVSEATAAKWVSGAMMGVISEYLSRSTTERSAAAQKRAVGEGKQIGRVAVGYERNGDGKLHICEAEAQVIQEAFRKAGISFEAAMDYLRKELPQYSWTASQVRKTLTKRTYLGEVKFGELVTKDAHEPIVTRQEFEAAQPDAGKPYRRGRAYPLSGVASCASCGGNLIGANGGRGARMYTCRNVGCPEPVVVTAERLEEYCREVLRSVWDERFTDGALLPANLQELQDTLEEAEAELAAFAADLTARRELGDQYHPALQVRVQARDKARAAFREASKDSAQQAPLSSDGLAHDASPDELGRLLAAAFRLISVRRGRLAIEQRVELLLHGSDKPVTLAQDVQGDSLKTVS